MKLIDQLIMPKPKLLPLAEASDEVLLREEHTRLASKHGCRTVPTVSLAQVIRQECLSVYEQAKVEKWMDRKGDWSWFPLREMDCERWRIHRQTKTAYEFSLGSMSRREYQLVVPVPVLITVDKLVKRLRNEVNFYVAAPGRGHDPFLAAVNADGTFIIERWDEPGFRG